MRPDREANHRAVDRATADSFSDVFLFALSAYPAIDVGASAWLYRDSPRVAWNMFVIDMQALSFTYLVTGGIKRIADRSRPIAAECAKDMSHDPTCGTAGSHYSFLSGHTSMSFTCAGLVCLHHLDRRALTIPHFSFDSSTAQKRSLGRATRTRW